MSRFAAFAIAAAIALPSAAVATSVDFEDLGTAFGQLGTSFQSGGYQFTVTSGDALLYTPGVVPTVPESGSTSIGLSNQTSAPVPVNSSITMTRIDGRAFNLASFRAGEGRVNGQFFAAFSATGLDLSGLSATGGTTTATIDFDGVATGNGATDLETFSPIGFSNLQSLTFTGFGGTRGGYSFLLDDIAVAPVPVPAGLPLLVAALGGLAMLRRRRRA